MKIDRGLLTLTLTFTILGVIAIANVSAPQAQANFGDSFYYGRAQAVWAVVGIIALFLGSFIHFSFWKKLANPILFVSLFLLILVLIPGFGARLLGARRWIVIGIISFQPSEFVKLALTIYLARVASSSKHLISYIAPMGLVGLLIMFQPDLGTTVVTLGIAFVQVFLSGVALLPFIGVACLSGLLGAILILVSDYRRERLLTYLTITSDPLGKSYHIRQVLLALGSGGLFGVGIGNSRQKYLFLPEAATDSIFAIIAEELGFIGASVLIILFLILVYKIIKISSHAPDKFSSILAVGVATWIGGQAFLNLGSMVALTPITGVPLPFFSYGGSSLVTLLFAVGIVLNISKYSHKSSAPRKRKRS